MTHSSKKVHYLEIMSRNNTCLIIECFDAVAKFECMREKWICFDLLVLIMKRYSKDVSILSGRHIKRIIKSNRLSECNFISPSGCFYREKKLNKKKRKRDESSSTQICRKSRLQGVYITDERAIPPQSDTPWHSSLITGISSTTKNGI